MKTKRIKIYGWVFAILGLTAAVTLSGCGGGTEQIYGELLDPVSAPDNATSVWSESLVTTDNTTLLATYYLDGTNIIAKEYPVAIGTKVESSGVTQEIISNVIPRSQAVTFVKKSGNVNGNLTVAYWNSQLTDGSLVKDGDNVTASYTVMTFTTGSDNFSIKTTMTGTVAQNGSLNFNRAKIQYQPASAGTDNETTVNITWTLKSGVSPL